MTVGLVCAQSSDAAKPSEVPPGDEFYEEAVDWCPWPDFINIICFPEAGYAYINFIKFSVEENGSYFGDFPVLCTIPGLDKLPASGWIYDPKTGYSCWISVEVGNGKLDLDNYGLIPTAARQLK
ncbi:MAG: hypothetical protein SFU85_02420, partial [Candidatus Methylacidiphilales bacterium]|nr:hypothetical protein [Candidatus Methylacidiphilales bacterium]